MSRKKIPKKVADDLLFRCDRKCSICEVAGNHIHHIDGNSDNNNIDNLIFLCFDHHNEVSRSSGLSRGLTPGLLRKYRDLLYQKINNNRKNCNMLLTQKDNVSFPEMTYQQMYDALISREIHKEFSLLSLGEWKKIGEWVANLTQYQYRTGDRAIQNILEVLFDLSSSTRDSMPASVATSIGSVCRSYIFQLNSIRTPPESWSAIINSNIALVGAIGEGLAYDGSLYLNNGRVFMVGSSLLWRSMRVAEEIGNKELNGRIEECYETAENGAGRSELHYSTEVLRLQKVFAKSKLNGRISYPEEFRKIPWLIWE